MGKMTNLFKEQHFMGELKCCYFSVAKWCLILCNPMDSSTTGFPILHRLPELAQAHVHLVSDAIQPSYPLLPPSSAFSFPKHQVLFQ